MDLITGALIALLGALIGAWASHKLEGTARREERAAAQISRESQISVDAYALRRQLNSWLRDSHAEATTLERAQEWAKRISSGFDAAEERASRVAEIAADISSDRAVAARRAFVLFYEATAFLNGAAAGDFLVWQHNEKPQEVLVRPGALDLVREAREKLEHCVAELEKAIDRALLDAEGSV